MIPAYLAFLALATAPAADQPVSPQPKRLSTITSHVGKLIPRAEVLSEQDFSNTILGRSFRYRSVGTDPEIVINSPREFFGEQQRYSFGHRAISHGTYSIAGGVVSINTPGKTFLGLGRKRIFFRHDDKVFTTGADVGSSVYELVPNP